MHTFQNCVLNNEQWPYAHSLPSSNMKMAELWLRVGSIDLRFVLILFFEYSALFQYFCEACINVNILVMFIISMDMKSMVLIAYVLNIWYWLNTVWIDITLN